MHIEIGWKFNLCQIDWNSESVFIYACFFFFSLSLFFCCFFPFCFCVSVRYFSSINYQRSYSHSQAAEVEEPDYASPTNNTNHKSLPDLHSHTQTNRNSPYSEYSEGRGNRSNKSNSSLNRDSGGSSGGYRSEPFYKQEPYKSQPPSQSKSAQSPYSTQNYTQKYYGPDNRRDSGSSTQHSGNSYYASYGGDIGTGNGNGSRYDCNECDNNQNSPNNDANCLLNFTTSVVPEAFQDHFSDNEIDDSKLSRRYVDEAPILRASRVSTYYSARGGSYNDGGLGGIGGAGRNRNGYYDPNIQGSDAALAVRSGGGDLFSPIESELSPPLGTFKRQKCLRLKQHPSRHTSPSDRIPMCDNTGMDDRKPILRSKSDISHRYFSRNLHKSDASAYLPENGAISEHQRAKSENFSELEQLERFFDRLGLAGDDRCDSSESNRSSPVFFSDVATVDSDQLPDSTETQLDTQPYRPIEPTSIVERNARIIKWLCTCRKMQVT